MGVVCALVGVELLLEHFKWAPRSLGATDGLTISFSPDTLFQNENTPQLQVDREHGRRTGEQETQNRTLPQILFYGDSMTFGAGVHAEETFPYHVQLALGKGVRVKNLGVIGFGPDQATKLALRSRPQTKQAIGVLTVFPGNDFKDLLSNRLIRCREGLCAWSSAHILSPFLSKYRLINLIRGGFLGKAAIPGTVIAELFNDPEAPYDTLSVHEREQTEAQLSFALSEFAGIFSRKRTLIVVLPPYSAIKDPSDRATESYKVAVSIVSKTGLPTVTLEHSLLSTSYLPNDHHLNQDGHKRVSEAVIPRLKAMISELNS